MPNVITKKMRINEKGIIISNEEGYDDDVLIDWGEHYFFC